MLLDLQGRDQGVIRGSSGSLSIQMKEKKSVEGSFV